MNSKLRFQLQLDNSGSMWHVIHFRVYIMYTFQVHRQAIPYSSAVIFSLSVYQKQRQAVGNWSVMYLQFKLLVVGCKFCGVLVQVATNKIRSHIWKRSNALILIIWLDLKLTIVPPLMILMVHNDMREELIFMLLKLLQIRD